MGTMILLYENFADAAVLSGGSWQVPLTAMQDPRPTRRARSLGVGPEATTWHVTFTEERTFKAMAFGPTNMSPGARYRIRSWSDAAFSDLEYDNGWETFGPPPVPSLSLPWESPRFWLGSAPFDDPDNAGIWAISVFSSERTAQWWTFEVEDMANPDGFLEVGRLFMARAYIPSVNFAPDNNNFGFETFTTTQRALGGTRYYNRRKAARRLRFSFPVLPDTEMWDDIYRIAQVAGLDKQVFVIQDPDDLTNRNKRSFLGNLNQLPEIQLAIMENASTAFDVTEAL